MLSTENILIKSTPHEDKAIHFTLHTATVLVRASTVLPSDCTSDEQLRADFRGAIWQHVYGELLAPIQELINLVGTDQPATTKQRVSELQEELSNLLELK